MAIDVTEENDREEIAGGLTLKAAGRPGIGLCPDAGRVCSVEADADDAAVGDAEVNGAAAWASGIGIVSPSAEDVGGTCVDCSETIVALSPIGFAAGNWPPIGGDAGESTCVGVVKAGDVEGSETRDCSAAKGCVKLRLTSANAAPVVA